MAGRDDTEQVRGVVQSIIFQAKESGWTVVELLGETHFTAVGTMPKLAAGESVVLTGSWQQHEIYGRQFAVTMIERSLPTDKDAIQRYLESGAVKGIGPVLAKRIVARFGDKSLDIIAEAPEKLAAISGISRKMARRFQNVMAEEDSERDLALLLLPAGISYRRIVKIRDLLGLGAVQAIREDPWILARKVRGIGFETCDRIARSLGFDDHHPTRIRGAVVHAVYEQLNLGHTWSPFSQLIEQAGGRLGVEYEKIEEALDPLPPELNRFDLDGRSVLSLRAVARTEEMTGERMKKVLSPHKKKAHDYASRAIEVQAETLGLELAAEQVEAVAMAMREPFAVITGGPGTGKTTIIRVLVTLAEQSGQSVTLAAPTGRAARRMQEATGREAVTLHRLLNLTPSDDLQFDASPSERTIRHDLVIVDEASMIDLNLFASLLFSLSDETRLLLVGDADQLPSIGPGQILTDLLSVAAIPRTRLSRIYRQDASNLIVLNAHRLRDGEQLSLVQTLESPFLFVAREQDDSIPDAVLQLIERVLPESYGITEPRDVQILAPMRRGAAGVTHLNEIVQAALLQDEEAPSIRHGEQLFRVGDKVMQTRNNYNLAYRDETGGPDGSGIMNGEVGIVTAIDTDERTLTVLFEEERLCELDADALDDIELAYAVTIHKSQGSEYPVVILALGMGPPTFMTRNLVYTAFTRAKRRLFVVGRRRTLEFVRKNHRIGLRRTLFATFLDDIMSGHQD